ncbi:PREDICTED: pyrin [Galeopterus variegatus]|uniref:Pyrin n=1 Tax=Galeopterus variegatus TaxID=482537 RepID=A0ABM0QXT7_GALVR|nr:PREDICTED: pyrin [Galeopterus variegatus]
MAKTPSDHLLFTLEELVPYDFEKFKFKLQNTTLVKEQSRIPRGKLQTARPVKLATLLVTHYGEEYAVWLTLQVLRAINQRLLAEELQRATGQEYSTQESGTDISAESCSSGENKPKSLKIPAGPEGDGQRLSGDGAASLLSSQPEAGRGPLKKSQDKRREQKGPEGLDAQGKPWARRSPVPGKPLGDIKASAGLRRNASSAGRLQGLSSGALGRRESKKYEVYLPSGKKRPRSLEFTISSEEREPPDPETLLTQEEMRTVNLDSAATPRGDNTLDVGAAGALEKGFRNPEHSMTGRPQDKAVCSFCHVQGGDPVGGTCVHNSCSCPVASEDPSASGSPLPSCPRCQGSLMRKSSGSLSPQPLPHCKRHMKQVQLLFCEDHGEPICLICRLSQEHQGHWVHPIEEAALEYKEQIEKQLEHLKKLRISGEEQRLQGDEKMANFLKQTETQRQKIRCQLEQLCQFLEQQEKLFVAWLEQLDQTISKVRETYGTQVSRDITLLDELIGELEAKQHQSDWELLQDIGVTLHRAKTVTIPELWTTPPELKEKIHLLYQKSEFVEKSMKHFSETLRSEIETFSVPELISAQAHAVNVILDTETAHPNLIFSDDLKSVRLGNKWDRLPDSPERFDSCVIALGLPSFLSGRHYWEVEVGDKTGWVLGVCKASTSRKGSMTLSPENGYWVVMMTKRNEYQASTLPPTRVRMREPPSRVGIFLDYKAGDISFYNVTARSHIYTFSSFSASGPLQPIFSPGTHDGGKNTGPLIICAVGGQGPP